MFPWGGSPPPSDREATVQREIRLNGRLPQYSRPTPTNRPMAVQAELLELVLRQARELL